MIKYKLYKEGVGSFFVMDDILSDSVLLNLSDDLGLTFKFKRGGLYMYVPEDKTDHLEDIMEDFMERGFMLSWKGKCQQ